MGMGMLITPATNRTTVVDMQAMIPRAPKSDALGIGCRINGAGASYAVLRSASKTTDGRAPTRTVELTSPGIWEKVRLVVQMA